MPLPVPHEDNDVPVRSFGYPSGPQPDTVFLHGVLCSTAMWKRVAMADPANRSIALPLPGHFPWRLDEASALHMLTDCRFLEAYRHAILKMTDRPVQIVAHSTGALIALKFAATYPEMVKRLVLTGAFACGRTAVGRSSMAMGVLLPLIGSSLFTGLYASWLHSPRTFALGLSTAKAPVARIAGAKPPVRALDAVEKDMLRDLRRSDPKALRQVVQWLSRMTVNEDIRSIETPVTVAVTQEDNTVAPLTQLDLLNRLPNANAVICRSGHLPMLEVPEMMRRLVFDDPLASASSQLPRAA